ncbi:MAG: hypothetical protein JWR24_1248 [Actinoallomurus sp.]|nr:hypothetical protein [Actinoallomurus sp.]
MDERAPRPGRFTEPGRADDRPAGRHGRRRRVVLYIAGGLLGSGWWLFRILDDSTVFSKIPTTVNVPLFVLASGVVVVACWGLLLILGEVMLFALAVVKAGDREQYDLYRNLMILWGYVLTLGIPRLFRKLPAQFAPSPDDPGILSARRGKAGGGASRRRGAGRHRQEACGPRAAAGGPESPEDARPGGDEAAEDGSPCPRTASPERSTSVRPVVPDRSACLGPVVPERAGSPGPTSASAADEIDLRTALDLLLRYAVRHIDDDAAAGPGGPDAAAGDAAVLSASAGTGRDD